MSLNKKRPKVLKNVKLVTGKVQDTLENFLKNKKDKKIIFAHMDMDTYASTKYALNCIKPFLEESKTSLKEFQCRARIDDITAELNRRLGMPLYIPFISIIICYLLSSRKESKYSFFQKYIVFISAFTVLVLAEIMVRYSGNSALNSIIYYSLPPSLILLNYLNLIRIFKFENLNQ